MGQLVPLEPEPLGEDVVAMLEDLLAAAKREEFSSVAVAIVLRDGGTRVLNTFAPSVPALLGAVARLQFNLLANA